MRSITSGLAAANPGGEPAAEHRVGDRARPLRRGRSPPARSSAAAGRAAPRCSTGPAARPARARAAATHMLIIPPIDSPHSDARSIPSRSRSASKSPPRSAIEYGPGGTGEDPWPRMS